MSIIQPGSTKQDSSLDGIRIALVYPPYGPVLNEPGIRVVKENYGVFPSLSLLYVAGILERAGCEVLFLDAHAEGMSLEETIRRLKHFKPDFIGYTLTTYLFFQTLEWIAAIRRAVPAPTLVGGVHLSLYPRETLFYSCIDYAVTGEAESTLPVLLREILGGGDLSRVPGIAFKAEPVLRDDHFNPDVHVVVTPPAPPTDVESAPFPARHLIDNSIYYSFITQYRNFTPLITSRGCPYRCIFCEQGSKTYRPRSPGNVVDEIELVCREFGVRELDFFDSSFTIQKDRVMGICDEMTRRGLNVVWAARSRVDCVNPEVLSAMRRAGCVRIYYGIESGNPQILKVLRKATDLGQIERVIRQTRQHGIDAFGYFMIGNPGDTAATIRQTIRLSVKLDLDYAQFSKVTPMPGTELYEMLLAETGRDWWRERIMGGPELHIPRPGCHLSESQVQSWTRQAYLRFYFRPRYVFRAIRRTRSLEQLGRSVSTAVQMLLER